MDAQVASLLKRARDKVQKRGFHVWLYYVTTGSVSRGVVTEAQRRASPDTFVEIFDGKRVLLVLRDYLDGVAPPIPSVDLELESGPGVKVNGILQRFDEPNGIESWVISMRGDAVARLFTLGGPRLFARNIRGFLGQSTAINKGMIKTLDEHADRFFYFNNGVTIVCDHAKRESVKSRDVLRVRNPQVINGQQTTRTLATHNSGDSGASVLLKVISIPRGERSRDTFDEMVSEIVRCTNWQNAITPSDLVANDRLQVELERGLRRFGYAYLRKRMTKGEASTQFSGKHWKFVKKEDFAQAVAGCQLDPVIVRSGKENLFREDRYSDVFPNSDPEYFLIRYWSMRYVGAATRGFPQRAYGKWLALNFLWRQLVPILRPQRNARAYRLMSEYGDVEIERPMRQALTQVFNAIGRYYRANRGAGSSAIDVSQFFRNRRGHDVAFRSFWQTHETASQVKLARTIERIETGLSSYQALNSA